MRPTSCPCRKAFNITNIQDLVICTQVLWLACSINSTILHFWSPHTATCVVRTVFTHAESRLCSCRPSWSYGVKTFHLQKYGDLGDLYTTSEKWWTTSWTWHLRNILIQILQKHLENTERSWTCFRIVATNLRELNLFSWSVCVERDNQTLSRSKQTPLCPCSSTGSTTQCLAYQRLILLACGKILNKRLWQVQATLFFSGTGFLLKCVSSWFPFSHGKTGPCCKSNW